MQINGEWKKLTNQLQLLWVTNSQLSMLAVIKYLCRRVLVPNLTQILFLSLVFNNIYGWSTNYLYFIKSIKNLTRSGKYYKYFKMKKNNILLLWNFSFLFDAWKEITALYKASGGLKVKGTPQQQMNDALKHCYIYRTCRHYLQIERNVIISRSAFLMYYLIFIYY